MAFQKHTHYYLPLALLGAMMLQWFFLQGAGYLGKMFFAAAPFTPLLLKANFSSLALLAATWLFYKFVFGEHIKHAGIFKTGIRKNIRTGMVAALCVLGLSTIILLVGNYISFQKTTESWTTMAPVFLTMGMVAFAEEIFIRGCFQRSLAQKFNPRKAWWMTALIFMLMHAGNPGQNMLSLPGIFVGGLVLGVNYLYSGNLWFGIALHWTWNFVQGCLLGFPVSGIALPTLYQPSLHGPTWLTGGTFGLEASLLTTVLQLVVLAWLYRHYAKQQYPKW